MSMRLITPPTVAAEPLQVGDVSTWLADPSDDHATDIQALIVAAREDAEGINGRVLAVSTWEKALEAWPGKTYIELLEPLKVVAPATSAITSFTYKDSDGTTHAMTEGADFIVDADSRPGRVMLPYSGSWPTATLWPASPIKIRFTAGMSPGDVEESIKVYMRAHVQASFDQPALVTENQSKRNPFIQNLAARNAVVRF